jgi:propionyl-CoA carboxylase alpha chain
MAQLPAMVESCRREAAGAFGDDRVFLERFLARPRHIEVQIMGDRRGTVIHLFERECSIQRRHQKVIEESPSPTIDDELRARLCTAAVDAGRALGYEGAGTVEFVVGAGGEPAFLEVNTRLQVEHPVTEAVAGVDLVRLQLLVAEGQPLPIAQSELRSHGHAIEARLYAEDPASGYLPAAGRIISLCPGSAEEVRWDAGVRTGSIVSSYYDPMLAKVIAWAETRGEAARSLERALRQTHFHGPATNRDLLCGVLRHPEFLAGELTTSFLDEHFSEKSQRAPRPAADVIERAAIAAALTGEAQRRAGRTLPSGWRNNRANDQTVCLQLAGDAIDVAYRQERDGAWTVTVAGRSIRAERPAAHADSIELVLDGHRVVATVSAAAEADGLHWEVTTPRGHAHLVELPRFPDPAPPEVAGATRAPMHGTVVAIPVRVGDRVAKGELLCIVEAMKMEQQLIAPYDALVASLEVKVGDSVETDQVLAVLDEVT